MNRDNQYVYLSSSCTLPKLYNRPGRAACYNASSWPVATQSREATTVTKKSLQRSGKQPKKPDSRLVPLEKASCGIAMEIAKADSRTDWEKMMLHINDSIRDTQQQKMLGQYMIQKLKKEQRMENIPPEQAAANKRCLESLIEKYGTGLEGIVSKEKEFERLIEAYQVFIRGDKTKTQRKTERKQITRKLRTTEEPLPAIGDQRAGRSQVGCRIRQEMRKEYGEKLRLGSRAGQSGKPVLHTMPGSAQKPMQVKVRKSQTPEVLEDRACDEVDLPPTPRSPVQQVEEEHPEEEAVSQLSMTYVPSESQSLAKLIPDEDVTVEINPEGEETEEVVEHEMEDEEAIPGAAKAEDDCLVLEGDNDEDVLVVNSETELIPSQPAQTPKFEIISEAAASEGKADKETEAEVTKEEPAAVQEPEKARVVTEEPATVDATSEEPVKAEIAPEEPVKADIAPEEPVKADIAPEEPVKTEFAAEEPVKAEVAAEEPVAVAATVDVTSEEPVKDEKALEEPVKDEITPEEPVKAEIAAEEPVKDGMTPEEPVKAEITPEEPAKSEVAVEKPVAVAATVDDATEEPLPVAIAAEVAVTAEEPDIADAAVMPEAVEVVKIGEDPYQAIAADLVIGVLQKLDQEAAPDKIESETETDASRVKFKSSPDIHYYEKQTPESDLVCHPDDKLILSEDLSTAESELNEEAKALYHKVLSTAHTDTDTSAESEPTSTEAEPAPATVTTSEPATASESGPGTATESEPAASEPVVAEPAPVVSAEPAPVVAEPAPAVSAEPAVTAEDEGIAHLARELTDTALKNAAKKSEEDTEEKQEIRPVTDAAPVTPTEAPDEQVSTLARQLSENALNSAAGSAE